MPGRIIDYQPIERARITWRDGAPFSLQFDDVYYHPALGKAETDYVFIAQNCLTERFSALAAQAHFTIAETGFGTGLNFFAAAQHFLAHADKTAHLHFVSTEKYPLHIDDIVRALTPWPEFQPLLRALCEHYPPATPGLHTLDLFDGRIHLYLFFGDVALGLEQMHFNADAWFLDGFAPSKNTDMWQEKLTTLIAQHSRIGTTFATFTAAGAVRRQLQSAGFHVEKVKGFGHKREMLRGAFTGTQSLEHTPDHTRHSTIVADSVAETVADTVADTQSKKTNHQQPSTQTFSASQQPWFFHLKPNAQEPANNAQRSRHSSSAPSVAVIGAGLAGCATAHVLAEAGMQVHVFERADKCAQETSGNHAGITYCSFSHKPNAQSRYYWTSYLHATRTLPHITPFAHAPTGVMYLAKDAAQQTHYTAIAQSGFYDAQITHQSHAQFLTEAEINAQVDALGQPAFQLQESDSTDAKSADTISGVWMPDATALRPSILCRSLLEHPLITTHYQTEITQLSRSDVLWQLLSADNAIYHADYVIIANAHAASHFEQTAFLSMRTIRGQTTTLPEDVLDYPSGYALCQSSYITPALDGKISIGATFDLHSDATDVTVEDHAKNLEAACALVPALSGTFASLNASALDGHAGLRCQTNDYLPIVGPVPDVDAYLRDYHALAKGQLKTPFPAATMQPNLYVHTALGSRGITHSLLNARLLLAHIQRTPQPLEKDILASLYPARFIIKKIKRRQ